MKKRILSVMLVLCMVLGMMPTAFAEDDTSGSVDVTTFAELKIALEAAAAAGSGDTTINIQNNITLAESERWSAVNIDGYHGADTITIHGNGHTISGLDAPLFSGGFAGGSGLVVDQLTLDNVTINDSTSSTGVGAFIGSVDSMDVVSLTDCHLTNSTITCTGGPRVGGLIGWTSGYNNQNDGPVDTQITIDNCSVENCEITSNGSVGGLIGHAGANPATYHTIRNCTVTGNTLTSTDDGGWRVGIVVGTANVGELAMDGITESGNTLAQTGKEVPANTLYGRFVPGDTGTLTIDGTPVFGSDIVAQNGSSGYKTLSAAVDAAATGDTITLLTDISEDVTIPEGKDVTLDLGGHTMTVPSDCGIEVLGLLTVTDSGENGTITCTDTPIRVNGSGAKFTLESGAVISTDDYGIYAKDNGTAVVNGGSISSKDAALSGNNTTGDMNFEVHGGTITAAQGPAIYMPGQVNLTITDGTLNGGISLRMGQVNISGGIINSITENIDSPSEYYGYSGNAWFPDALYVFGGTYTSENATYGNSLDLNITGGTFNCLNDQGSSIAIYDLGKVAQEENISISGDAKLTSTSTSRKSYQVLSLDDIGVTDSAYGAYSGNVNSTITGGSFSADPADYLSEDYQSVAGEDGLYTVSMKDAVATIGENKYTSLTKAIAAAQDDDTVTLVADTTEDITISGKKLTLDLGGKTLTNTGIGKATLFVGSNAVVSVQNGSIVGGASYYNIQCGTEADPTGSIELTDVTATAGNDGSSMIDNWGILTIHSGTYTGGMNTVKSEPTGALTINGGDFTCTYAASYSYNGVVLSYGTATVTDGTFTHTATTPNWAYPCAFMTAKDKDTDPTPHTTITGGTFTVKHSRGKSIWGYGKANSSNFEISGGHYSPAPSTSAVAEGYGVTDKVDGYYGIAPANAITIEPLTNGKITTTSPAPEGKKVTLRITATTGYVLDTISVKTASGTEVAVTGSVTSKTFTMPAEAVTVSATFKKADYKITIKATNGTVTAPATAQYGETVSLAVTPDPGYELSTISVKKSTTKVTLNEDSTFTMPAGAVTVTATFKAIPYGIAVAEGITNGMVTVEAETATVGTTVPVTVSPAEGYALKELYYTTEGSDEHHAIEAVDDGYTLNMPAEAVTIHAAFQKLTYTVTVADGIAHGTIAAAATFPWDDTVTVTVTPDTGYELEKLTYTAEGSETAEEVTANEDGAYTFTMPKANVVLNAAFQKSVYTVTVDEKIENGKVTVDPENASMGDTVTVSATPVEGYELDAITVTSGKTTVTVKDGKFTMPAGNVTVSATFKKAAAPSPEPSVSTTTTVSTDVSTDIPSADKKAIEAVLDDASVEGIEKAADTGDILDAAGVTEADTKAKKVEIEITTKVIAEGADLSAGTLTFSAAPVATITIDGKKVSKDVPVTNDMLNGKNITIKLPLPKGFVPEEIIHISNDGLRQHYTAQDFKVETTENGGQVAVLKITHFSQFILNAKTHVHTWDQGTVITEPTATTDGTMHYVCTVCGDEKDEVIPAVPATQLTLDPPSVRLAAGKTQALTLTVVPENATGTVIWSSSNPAVATVDETGNVTAVAAGTTTITAVLGTQTAVATISVVCGTDTCQYYTDVDAGAWYHPAVDFVTEHKLMQGVDAKARTFVPGHELTRAQLAQVLYNMENPGDTASEKSFKDVKQGAWYYNAVIWAADNGIVKGYEDGCFYPNRPITREQMVTMLYRYMQFKGLKVDASSEDWKSFTDYANVHAWAQDAMAWAVHNGVVNGIQNNQLAPTHTAQRSQVAKIIMEITMLYDLA